MCAFRAIALHGSLFRFGCSYLIKWTNRKKCLKIHFKRRGKTITFLIGMVSKSPQTLTQDISHCLATFITIKLTCYSWKRPLFLLCFVSNLKYYPHTSQSDSFNSFASRVSFSVSFSVASFRIVIFVNYKTAAFSIQREREKRQQKQHIRKMITCVHKSSEDWKCRAHASI